MQEPTPNFEKRFESDLTIQDVIEAAGSSFLGTLPSGVAAVLRKIRGCGNGAFGYHLHKCNRCGHSEYSARQCLNRNCLMCGAADSMQWIEDRAEELLPLRYGHFVFDLPEALHDLSFGNKKVIYDLSLRAPSEAFVAMASADDVPFLPAIVGTLHSWNQRVDYFPHVHFLASFGGYDSESDTLLSLPCDSAVYAKEKLVEKVVAVFVAGLEKLRRKKKLDFSSERLRHLAEPDAWDDLVRKVSSPEAWKVYAGPTHGGPLNTIRYMGEYVSKVAISNDRILAIRDGQVTFRYEDRKKGCQSTRTLPVESFLKLFCLHFMPKNFHVFRTSGLLSHRDLLERAKKATVVGVAVERPAPMEKKADDDIHELCPVCKVGRMYRIFTTYHRFPTERELKTLRCLGVDPPPEKDLYYEEKR